MESSEININDEVSRDVKMPDFTVTGSVIDAQELSSQWAPRYTYPLHYNTLQNFTKKAMEAILILAILNVLLLRSIHCTHTNAQNNTINQTMRQFLRPNANFTEISSIWNLVFTILEPSWISIDNPSVNWSNDCISSRLLATTIKFYWSNSS